MTLSGAIDSVELRNGCLPPPCRIGGRIPVLQSCSILSATPMTCSHRCLPYEKPVPGNLELESDESIAMQFEGVLLLTLIIIILALSSGLSTFCLELVSKLGEARISETTSV